MNETIKFLQKNTWSITLTLWLLGVAFAGFNLYITSQLSPLASSINTITSKVEANEKKDDTEHPSFASKEELKMIISQQNKRLDSIDANLRTLIAR